MKSVTKKIISLFAAMAMVATLFSSFAFAATVSSKYVMELDSSSTTSLAVIKVKADLGEGETLQGGSFVIALDDSVFDTSALTGTDWYIKDSNNAMGQVNYTSSGIKASIVSVTGYTFGTIDGKENTDNTCFIFKVPIKAGVLKTAKTVEMTSGELKLTSNDKAVIGGTASDTVTAIQAPTVTIPKDDTIKPDSEVQPDPVKTPTPVEEQPEAGYNLVLDEANTDISDEENPQITVKVVAVLPDDAVIQGGSIVIPVDTDIVDTAKLTGTDWYKKDSNNAMGQVNYTSSGIKASIVSVSGYTFGTIDGKENTDNTCFIFTLPLKAPLSDIYDIAIGSGELKLTTNVKYVIGEAETPNIAINAPTLRVDPVDYIDTKGATTAPLSANMSKGAEDAAKAAEDEGKTVYVTVKVGKDNDDGTFTEADYYTDFVAEYPEGTVLSEAEYKNLISGNTDTPVSDVIKGLKFKIFNTANAAKISTALNSKAADGTLEPQLVDPVDGEDISTGNTTPDKYVASNIALKDNGTKSATLGKEVTNTITVTPGSKNGEAYAYETVEFKLTNESIAQLNLPGVQISYKDANGDTQTVTVADDSAKTLPAAVDGKYTVKFTAGAEGKVSYTVSYVGYDNNGVANTTPKTATVTYTISAAATDNPTNPGAGSGSGSSSTKGGSIATGYQGGTTAGLPGSASFTDLGDADWATEAVTMLAYQNIVSGYEDNTFRPNGNITRAEFAQILINAIGHNGDSADTYFDDVPTDAWFYHNVAVASQLGIVSGYGDGNFGPYDLITREQMALMTQKAAKVMNVNLSGADAGTFADDADIADWSKAAVYELANAGIINGMGDGTFAPKANATRAQASVIIYNTFVK